MSPRSPKIALNVAAWSDESRRSTAAECAGASYDDVALCCRHCGRDFTFSAQQQREAFEVRKDYIWKRPVLCPDCWPVRVRLMAELKTLRSRWSAQRSQMKRDGAALLRWRDVLVQLVSYGYRRDRAQISMLGRLLAIEHRPDIDPG
jgi:hypothetical protein